MNPPQPEKSVALIELGSGHTECVFSQILFLQKAGYVVHLICSERLRNQVEGFAHVHRCVFLHHGDTFAGHWKCVLTIRRYLHAHRIRTVIFNTGSGNHTRDISLTAPRGTTMAGLVHHTHKLKGSFTQWLIALRVKKNFVLNDYLLDSVPAKRTKKFESTYLIFREPVNDAQSVRKASSEMWVGIPGEVDFRRRAYNELVDELVGRLLPPSVRFVLLGKCARHGDGLAFRELIRDRGIVQQFILFDDFLSTDMFVGYLKQCNVLLPLIHPSTHFFNHYKKHQVSGTYNLSFGFGIPLLLHESLKGPEDFASSAFFYKIHDLCPLLERLITHRHELDVKRSLILSNPKFSFERQAEKYVGFLEA